MHSHITQACPHFSIHLWGLAQGLAGRRPEKTSVECHKPALALSTLTPVRRHLLCQSTEIETTPCYLLATSTLLYRDNILHRHVLMLTVSRKTSGTAYLPLSGYANSSMITQTCNFTFRVLRFAKCFAFVPFSFETNLNGLINNETFILKQILKTDKSSANNPIFL